MTVRVSVQEHGWYMRPHAQQHARPDARPEVRLDARADAWADARSDTRSGTRDDEGQETVDGSSVDDFLRQVAFVPRVEPPGAERDRTGETLGRFQLTGVLGRGGMGVVYAARDRTLGRKVALKLLRAEAVAGEERRRRLLREARAAAAVSHPNIATVFEAGEVDGEVFIAMELVEGADARAWLAARPRSRREILDVFTMAGRGLAAAHRVGLVHRDFKPDNILIDAAGQAHVADFGLAVGTAGAAVDLATSADLVLPGSRLTQPGRVVGTPGYIAPECLAGRDADARADQFAFCVALYEALEGRRPHDEAALRAHDERVAPRLRRTPWWLRGVLARGLAPSPDARFPGMDALLARMERARVWPGRGLAALVVGAAALALWMAVPRQETPSCEAMAAEVPAAWMSARGSIREAFARASVPYAADAMDRVRLKLDEWTERWSQAQRSACRWPQSAAHECLARQQADLGAALALLGQADAQVVARAAALVDGLGDPARCVQGAAAQEVVAAPAFDDGKRLSPRVAEVRARLAAGKYAEAAALGESLRRDAQGVAAVEADAFAVAAMASWKAGKADALQALAEARWAAERARRDALSTELALALSEAYRDRAERERAEEWLGHAEATFARVGEDLRLESMVFAARAHIQGMLDRRSVASELALRSLALREQALGSEHLEVAESLLLAARLMAFDKVAMGTALARRALDIRVAALGNEHPDVATAWQYLGQTYGDQYDHRRQLEAQEHALRIRVAALGPDHPEVARSHWAVGNALAALGQEQAARAQFQTAREILDRVNGPGTVKAAVAGLVIAELDAQLGDVEAALARARAAIARIESVLGPGSAATIYELTMAADLLVEHGDLDEADGLYQRALRNGERRDPENAKLAWPLAGIAKLALVRGQPALAREAAARALRLGRLDYPSEHPVHLPAHQVLFHAALAAGELAQAREQAAHMQVIADAWLAADHPLRIDVQQVQALLAAASGDRPGAEALGRAALAAQEARPWQILRLAGARAVLGCVLGARDARGAQLVRAAVKELRAAKAFGSADATAARCRDRSPLSHRDH